MSTLAWVITGAAVTLTVLFLAAITLAFRRGVADDWSGRKRGER